MHSTEAIYKLAEESDMMPGEVRRLLSKRISEARNLRIRASTGGGALTRNNGKKVFDSDTCQIHLARIGHKPCPYRSKVVYDGYEVCGIHVKTLRRRMRILCTAHKITDRFEICSRVGDHEFNSKPVCFRHNNLLNGPLGTKSRKESWAGQKRNTENATKKLDSGVKV